MNENLFDLFISIARYSMRGLINALLLLGLILFSIGAAHAGNKTTKTKSQTPTLITYRELMKFSESDRKSYLEMVAQTLIEIENMHTKLPDRKYKSPSGAEARANPISPSQLLEALGLFESAMAAGERDSSTATITCISPYILSMMEISGTKYQGCVRTALIALAQKGKVRCENNEFFLSETCTAQVCSVDCILMETPALKEGRQRPACPVTTVQQGSNCVCQKGYSRIRGYCLRKLEQAEHCIDNEQRFHFAEDCSSDSGRPCTDYCSYAPGHRGEVPKKSDTKEGGAEGGGGKEDPETPKQEQTLCEPIECNHQEVHNDFALRFQTTPSRRCINAGVMTDYNHRAFVCPRVPSRSIGGFTTDACPRGMTICEPLVFGLLRNHKPLCVGSGPRTTFNCSEQSRRQGAISIFTNRPSSLTAQHLEAAWQRYREEFKQLCVEDEISKNFHCTECRIIAKRNAEFAEQLRRRGSTNPPGQLCMDASASSAQTPRPPQGASPPATR